MTRIVWLLTAAAAAVAAVAGCDSQPSSQSKVPEIRDVMNLPVTPTPPLDVGDTLPPLQAGGWVNGPPPKLDDPGLKLLVVDVWALWCPFCRTHAPILVRLHQKYADRGVRFVGLTNTPEGGVKSYAEITKTPWPNGYDTPPATVEALGAGSEMMTPGYQVAPIIYLVGPDGKIRWTDRRARMQHKGPVGWEKMLDDAIAAALDPPPAKQP